MPFGIDKSKGGDSPENVAKVERCVETLRRQGHSEESAIRICKSSLKRGKEPKRG